MINHKKLHLCKLTSNYELTVIFWDLTLYSSQKSGDNRILDLRHHTYLSGSNPGSCLSNNWKVARVELWILRGWRRESNPGSYLDFSWRAAGIDPGWWIPPTDTVSRRAVRIESCILLTFYSEYTVIKAFSGVLLLPVILGIITSNDW